MNKTFWLFLFLILFFIIIIIFGILLYRKHNINTPSIGDGELILLGDANARISNDLLNYIDLLSDSIDNYIAITKTTEIIDIPNNPLLELTQIYYVHLENNNYTYAAIGVRYKVVEVVNTEVYKRITLNDSKNNNKIINLILVITTNRDIEIELRRIPNSIIVPSVDISIPHQNITLNLKLFDSAWKFFSVYLLSIQFEIETTPPIEN